VSELVKNEPVMMIVDKNLYWNELLDLRAVAPTLRKLAIINCEIAVNKHQGKKLVYLFGEKQGTALKEKCVLEFLQISKCILYTVDSKPTRKPLKAARKRFTVFRDRTLQSQR